MILTRLLFAILGTSSPELNPQPLSVLRVYCFRLTGTIDRFVGDCLPRLLLFFLTL
nr:MAG TPA: hypothetical protein [Caudoviricetes sp.]